MAKKTAIGNTLRDIATESALEQGEKHSLRLIAKEFDKLCAKKEWLFKKVRDLTAKAVNKNG